MTTRRTVTAKRAMVTRHTLTTKRVVTTRPAGTTKRSKTTKRAVTTKQAVSNRFATPVAAALGLIGMDLGLPNPLRADQDVMTVTRTPLPAESPLAGPLWTFVVPLALFAIAFGATLALYRRFSQR